MTAPLPLVLDPEIFVYCGYVGGSGDDSGRGIAVDSLGNVYVVGSTVSAQPTFPLAVGPDLTKNGSQDAFVAKLNATGTALIYCGYIGGNSWDGGVDIAVDGSGNALVTGFTSSTQASFPVMVGPDLTHNGEYDVFMAKVNTSGTALVYCGYIGGSLSEDPAAIAVDGLGSAYVTGVTYSPETSFPVVVGPDLTYNSGWMIGDAFVAKVNSAGTALAYCGYIGGSATDTGNGIAVDGSGYAYVTGYTGSTESTFPAKVGPDLSYNGGIYDAYVARIEATGAALVYCGYIGGSGKDFGEGIAVDPAGNAYITPERRTHPRPPFRSLSARI